MITKHITYFGHPCILACDGNCSKAWGMSNRPKVMMSEDNEDDYAYLADGELGDAPCDPGTYDGLEMTGKPLTDGDRLNKWCARSCERSAIIEDAECTDIAAQLPDLSVRLFNIPRQA